MGRMTWDLATLQYYCWAGRAGRKADSDYAVDPDGPTRTTPQYYCWDGRAGREADSDYAVDRLGRQSPTRTTAPTHHGGRCGPVVWPVKYYLGGAGTPESTGVMSRLPETVPRLSLSRNFTADVVCNGGDPARAVTRNSGPPTGRDWSGPATPPAAARTTRMSRPVLRLTDLLIQPPAHVP